MDSSLTAQPHEKQPRSARPLLAGGAGSFHHRGGGTYDQTEQVDTNLFEPHEHFANPWTLYVLNKVIRV